MASDPTIEAARSIVEGRLAAIRAGLDGASTESLNWRPAGPDSNSMAVLTVHALSSTRFWLSVALDAPPADRDRDSEFRTEVAGLDELLAFVDRVEPDIRAALDGGAGYEPGARREAKDVTAAWALLLAVEHLGEHVAHLELTRQLWDRAGGGPG